MLSNLRDISIILLALESLIIGVILLLLLWQIRLLVVLLRDEIGPILKDTQETTQTVQSTTKFVSKRVAKPIVGAASFAAGLKGALRAMSGKNDVSYGRPAMVSRARPRHRAENEVPQTASSQASDSSQD